jgi:putative hemolysin
MLNKSYAVKDLSYAHSVGSKGGQTVINLLENATGRLALIKRARGYQDEIVKGRDFWQVIVERYGLSLDIMSGSLTNIPRAGPLILVANHPFGILDGVILGHILATIRGDFRILAHKVFQ